MKTYYFILTGDLTMTVQAKSEDEAFTKAQDYLEGNSPVRNWEIYSDRATDEPIDITVD